MNWYTLLPWCIFVLLSTACAVFYQLAKGHMAMKQAQSFSGGQAYVAQANAEATERTARANAYFTQVQSLEQAWQAFLENHIAVNGGTHEVSPKELRTLRAAFENMYDFSDKVNP